MPYSETFNPSSVDDCTNQIIGEDFNKAAKAVMVIIEGYEIIGAIFDIWAGRTAERISRIAGRYL
ncbi:MAG: hypothetical protein KJN64_09830 [Ignavibacteria bacterium]|nr:hypothetical protein [Ignavibacteria bacterium]MBT8382397.1 hypothetical protein [Ignavibacteria bacterium]MBT8391674.1 hypothetical protein [Ignavibacteria bacterium]NNL21162.1 hypothetical protein [Ignavibacteriaceae bacterium]